MDSKKETVTVYDRERLTLGGVENIMAFDDGYVLLAVSRGEVCIEGENLKITSLSKESGEIVVIGSIKSILFYEENEGRHKRGKGIFK